MKYYCPWCGLELVSNQAGATHKDPAKAWEYNEVFHGGGCEYQVGDFLAHQPKNLPISELELEEAELLGLQKRKKTVAKEIRLEIKKKALRIEELKKEIGPRLIDPNK